MEFKSHLLCFNILKEIHTSARELVEKSRGTKKSKLKTVMGVGGEVGWTIVMYENGKMTFKSYGSIVNNVCPVVTVWLCPLEFMC